MAYVTRSSGFVTIQTAAFMNRHFPCSFDSVHTGCRVQRTALYATAAERPERGGAHLRTFREQFDETALGYASLVDFRESWFLNRGAKDMLSHLWTGQHADIGAIWKTRQPFDRCPSHLPAFCRHPATPQQRGFSGLGERAPHGVRCDGARSAASWGGPKSDRAGSGFPARIHRAPCRRSAPPRRRLACGCARCASPPAHRHSARQG